MEQVQQRRSIRLQGYDYTRPGYYFVTACTQDRRRVFGTLVNGRMALNDAGRMVKAVWDELPAHYPGVGIDAFVAMPDHIHGIVRIVGAGPRACPFPEDGQARGPASTLSLPDVVHRFKTLTTKRYVDGVRQCGWPRFPGRLWQRNYYEAIVRTGAALANIRAYIHSNPAHGDVLRYGEPRFSVGNQALLGLPLTAFLASRGSAQIDIRAALGDAACVVSGFLSPLERMVFPWCLAEDKPMVQVLARGIPAVFPAPAQRAIAAGRLLVISPFPATETRFSAPQAAWCNQYVLQQARTIVIGHLSPDGMLACLLADAPPDTPVAFLAEKPTAGS